MTFSSMTDVRISRAFSVTTIGTDPGKCSRSKTQAGSAGLPFVRKNVTTNLLRSIAKYTSTVETTFGTISGRTIRWKVSTSALFRLRVVLLSDPLSDENVAATTVIVQGT